MIHRQEIAVPAIRRFLRVTSWLVLTSFISVSMQPLTAAMQLSEQRKMRVRDDAETKYAQLLAVLNLNVKTLKRHINPARQRELVERIYSQRDRLSALERQIEGKFAKIEGRLKASGTPLIVLQRHDALVSSYAAKRDALHRALDNLEGSADLASAIEEIERLSTDSSPKRHKDPTALAWQVLKPTFKRRAMGKAAAQKSLSTPTADDLAATPEVQISDAIRAKASDLGSNPLNIYSWVRNSVEFVPTFGSIEGSEGAWQKLTANDFDTASLLIAMLRAAGVPARYVFGQVQLPASTFQSWCGGLSTIEAAINIAGQGGISSAPLVAGGKITAVNIPHVWVEAWVDAFPSRGSVNRSGSAWVQLDPSFKQFHYAPTQRLKELIPFDAPGLKAAAMDGAQSSSVDGWVANLNHSNIEGRLGAYKSQVQALVDSSSLTLGDVVRSKSIVPEQLSVLPLSLPYKVLGIERRFSSAPPEMRHKFRFSLFASDLDRSLDNPVWTFERETAALVGKKLTLSFRPAASSDANLIAGFVPSPSASVGVADFPTSFPPYIRLVSELRLEDEIVEGGGNFALGDSLVTEGGFTTYDLGGWDLTSDATIIAGQYTAVGLSIQGISVAQLERLQARSLATMAQLGSRVYSGLTPDLVSGDFLTSIVWSYFANLQGSNGIAAPASGMYDQPGMSYGLIHTAAHAQKLFGTVTASVRYAGFLLDIGHVRHVRAELSNDLAAAATYSRMRGQFASVLEGKTLESNFGGREYCNIDGQDPSLPGCLQGSSAVKAIAAAEAEGQKIFTITAGNVHAIDLLAQPSTVRDDIEAAVGVGMEVAIHERPVTIDRWTGTGYVITDPATGSGGYLISGGASGGSFSSDVADLMSAALGLVIPSAQASDGLSHSALDAFFDALFKVLEHFGRGLGALLGVTFGKLKDAIDILKLIKACAGSPLKSIFGVVAQLELLTAAGAVAALTLGVAGLLGAALFLAVIFISTLLMDALIDAYANECAKP